MLKSIIIIVEIFLVLMLNCKVNSLKSEDICIKKVKCDGINNCGLTSCGERLDYECSRFECALNASLCEEYQNMIKFMNLRKSIQVDKHKTLSGLSFAAKKLAKFEKMKYNINECSFE